MYPNEPGFKVQGTSRDASRTIDAGNLRGQVLDVLKQDKFTADEVASKLSESVLAIRPRLSELRSFDLIKDSGSRRPNSSGRMAIVWELKS